MSKHVIKTQNQYITCESIRWEIYFFTPLLILQWSQVVYLLPSKFLSRQRGQRGNSVSLKSVLQVVNSTDMYGSVCLYFSPVWFEQDIPVINGCKNLFFVLNDVGYELKCALQTPVPAELRKKLILNSFWNYNEIEVKSFMSIHLWLL